MGSSYFVVRRAFRASSPSALKPTLGAASFPLFTPLDELFIEDFWRTGGGGGASAAGVLLGSGASGASALLPAQPMLLLVARAEQLCRRVIEDVQY